MRSSGNDSRLRVAGTIAALMAVGVLLSIFLITHQRQRVLLQADVSVRATVASAVTQVRTAIRDQLSQAAAGSEPGDVTVPVADVSKSSISLASAIEARDSGSAALDDSAHPPSMVVPIYRRGDAPRTTADRRDTITAYRVVPLSLRAVLAGLTPDSGGLAVRGPTHAVVAVPAAAPGNARSFAVDMDLTDAPGWTVVGWVPSPATPGITWFWVIGLLAVFAGLAAGAAFLLRRDFAATARQRQVERDRSLVTGLAPVLQASLDIGEVVPAASSHLVDGLALAGLSLSTPGDVGERQVFSWGTYPDAAVRPTNSPPTQLEPGQTFAVSLTRGGRVLGLLRVVAGDVLTRSDLVALATASELLGSTLANAEAFARQQDLLESMRSVDELKTVFLATASHELRTPVTAIVGFSALLVEHWDTMNTARGQGLMERVLVNGRRLETLIEQLLDFSQLERGLPRTNNELLDLGRTVGKILAEQPELATGHVLDSSLDERCMVRGSSSAVERIVTNLVGNAAKYSPTGTQVTVTVRTDGDRAVLLVDDEGPGVLDEDRDRVFSRFYRGRGDSVIKTSGAGIGLAIVAEYAASMAGTASVTQAPAGGARFTVTFPLVGVLAGAVVEGEPNVALS